ncbi:MAG: CoA transferase [Caulobacteraceae bacterium]|nr:CoA transferase [Caulobacteraceae bacterium]
MTIADAALAELMALAGRAQPDFVRIETGAPALRTRFHADEAAAAALAAGGVLAADLWRLRGGEGQAVSVSTREAAAGLVSFLHQRFEDESRAPNMRRAFDTERTAVAGFMPTRDGRTVFLHPSFPPSTARLVALLGCPDEREAVLKTVAGWDALDLEDAIAEAGVCGAMVRTPEEWDASDQGRALAALPVVEVIKLADSPPEPLPEPAGGADAPLSGARVLDLTRVLAGPTCARTLAQYGAQVLHVASPNLPLVEPFVSDTSHGKLSAYLDLAGEDSRARLRELVRGADVFSQGYRVGSLDRLGFGPLELARLRPGIIYASINCYGHEGGWRGRPGWEQLAQTVTGMAQLHGGEAGPELQPGAVTDYTTGYLAALGCLIALKRRALHGGSYLVRASLCQTGMWIRRLGYADAGRLDRVVPLGPEEIAGYAIRSETGYGPMRHLRPAVRMTATPPRWTRPTTPLGSHPAAWPDAA